jgi:aminomethyltransferase
MGYVDVQHAALDNEIFIDIRNNPVKARVVKMPFAK